MKKKKSPTTVEILSDNSGITLGTTTIHFHRTLRLPDDGRQYPLPPSLGHFPVKRVEDYIDRVPAAWKKHGGVFLPMHEREALWMSFEADVPAALKVGIGMVNAVTGKPWKQELDRDDQDYMVLPDQPWLDGIKTEGESIRQFIAMAMGEGYTVEGQLSGEEKHGGIQLLAFPMTAKKRKEWKAKQKGSRARLAFPAMAFSNEEVTYELQSLGDVDFKQSAMYEDAAAMPASAFSAKEESLDRMAPQARRMSAAKPARAEKEAEMGLGAGGRMQQEIYQDHYGVETWDQDSWGRVFVHIVTPAMYAKITGEAAPEAVIDASTYAQYGYPWFALDDKDKEGIEGSDILAGVKTIKELDAEKGKGQMQDDSTVKVDPKTIINHNHLPTPDPFKIVDGEWGIE